MIFNPRHARSFGQSVGGLSNYVAEQDEAVVKRVARSFAVFDLEVME
jgi:hypothetical protein